jgi:hypothetical protein
MAAMPGAPERPVAGWLGLLKWLAANPQVWPLLAAGFIAWELHQTLTALERIYWALLQRIDTLTEVIRGLERVAR